MTHLTSYASVPAVPATYSIYDAKTRLSEIIRTVKRRRSVVITERGRPVARVVPYEAEGARPIHERLRDLEAAGILLPPARSGARFRPIARRPGALRCFLAERD